MRNRFNRVWVASQQRGVRSTRGEGVDGNKRGIPTPGPTQRAARLANGGIALGHDAIIIFGHGTKLGAERKRRLLADMLHGFRVNSARRCQGIAHFGDALDIGQNMGERVASRRSRRFHFRRDNAPENPYPSPAPCRTAHRQSAGRPSRRAQFPARRRAGSHRSTADLRAHPRPGLDRPAP